MRQQVAEPVGDVVDVSFGCLHACIRCRRISILIFDSLARDPAQHEAAISPSVEANLLVPIIPSPAVGERIDHLFCQGLAGLSCDPRLLLLDLRVGVVLTWSSGGRSFSQIWLYSLPQAHFSSRALKSSNHGEIRGLMACAGTPFLKRSTGTLSRVRQSSVAER